MVVRTLQTAKLVLRQLEREDAASLHLVFADPETMQYWWRAPHASLTETEEAVAINADCSDTLACWAITKDSRVALGWINLRIKRDGVADVGYILSRKCWGQGLGREALAAVVSHGFGPMGLRRIAADTDPDNRGSIAVLRSLGFVQEGHLRGEWKTHIGVRDSLIFGLLAGEWDTP